MTEVNNAARRKWATAALRAFGERTGQTGYDYSDPECFGEIAGDLVANLLHLARDAGVSAHDLIERGWDHFEAEVYAEEGVWPDRG